MAEPQAPLWKGEPDPAPYAWLDDDARMAGSMPPSVTMGYGIFFLGAAVACAVAAVTSSHLFGLWIGLAFGAMGGFILHMGLARRAWRRRHPGVDPLTTVRSWTDGSPFGSDRRSAGVMRWVLLVVCGLLALFAAASLVATFVGSSSRGESASTLWGGRVLLVLLLALFVAVARADWRRIRQLRGRRRTGS